MICFPSTIFIICLFLRHLPVSSIFLFNLDAENLQENEWIELYFFMHNLSLLLMPLPALSCFACSPSLIPHRGPLTLTEHLELIADKEEPSQPPLGLFRRGIFHQAKGGERRGVNGEEGGG